MAASTKYVIDASFIIAALMPDEDYPDVDQMLRQFETGSVELISTPLLPFEVTNTLKVAVLRKRLKQKSALERLLEFLNYEIELSEVDFRQIFTLAEENNLTVYDASYLYLARINQIPLLTLDSKLKNAI